MSPISGAVPAEPDAIEMLLAEWSRDGRSLIAEHSVEFTELSGEIPPLLRRGRHAEAAAAIQRAANYAVLCHPGVFSSEKLESAIRSLGEAALAWEGRTRPDVMAEWLHVLHVSTEVAPVGGHARNMGRWIGQDTGNVHSVALTRQHAAVPEFLAGAVARSGGEVHRLNRTIGSVLAWARRLQRLMSSSDVVVLHTHCEDIIPLLALAGLRQRPPVLLVNHTDHLFWLGKDFSDLVVCSRRSGYQLCAERRGIKPERNYLMPLCLEPVTRRLSGRKAKRSLGLPEDAVMILSVARAMKFRPFGGVAFPDPLLPVLREDPRLHLVAVGASREDWSAAQAEVPGRIHMIPETPDTSIYLSAADIYLDTFPFVSITSLFEAGLHALPLVTRDLSSEVPTMAADSPGLDGSVICATSLLELQQAIRSLAADSDAREALGGRTRQQILDTNTGPGWQSALGSLYRRAFDIQPIGKSTDWPPDGPRFEAIDLWTPFVYGDIHRRRTRDARLAIATAFVLKESPLRYKLRHVAEMARRGSLGHMPMPAWRQFVPEWLGAWLRIAVPRRS